MPLVFLRWIRS